MSESPVRATIDYLTLCRAARAAGYRVAFTTDPAWLVHMAINRRAGWPDDPSSLRGSCRPNAGGSTLPIGQRYPRKGSGDAFRHLRLIANEINTPRLIVHAEQLGEWRAYLLKRIPERIEVERASFAAAVADGWPRDQAVSVWPGFEQFMCEGRAS